VFFYIHNLVHLAEIDKIEKRQNSLLIKANFTHISLILGKYLVCTILYKSMFLCYTALFVKSVVYYTQYTIFKESYLFIITCHNHMNRETINPQPNPEPQNRDLGDVLKSQPTDPDLFTSATPPEGLLERHTTKPRDPKISEILRDLPLPSQKKPENLSTPLEEAMKDVYSSIEDAAAKESNEREAQRAALIEEQGAERKNREEAKKEEVSNRIKHEEDNRKTRQENTRKDGAKRSLEYFLGLDKSSDRLAGLTPFLHKLTMNLREEAKNNNIQDGDPKEIYAFVDRIKALEQMDADLTYQEKQRKESNKEATPFIEGTFLGFRDDLRKVNIETLSAEDINKTTQSLIATIPQTIEQGTLKKTRDEFKGSLDESLKILQGSYNSPEIIKTRTVKQSPQKITPKEVPPSIIINPPTETLTQETAEMEQGVAVKEEGLSETDKEWFAKGESGEFSETTEMEQEVAIESAETEKKRGMLSRLIEKLRGKNKELEEEIQERVPTLFEKLRGRGSRVLVAGTMLVAVMTTFVKNIDSGGEHTDRATISAPAESGDGGGGGGALLQRRADGNYVLVKPSTVKGEEGGPQGQSKNPDENPAHTAIAEGEGQGEPEEVGPPEKGDEAAEPYKIKGGDGLIKVLEGLELDEDRYEELRKNIYAQTGYAKTGGHIDVPGSVIHRFETGVKYRINNGVLEHNKSGKWGTAMPDHTVSGQAKTASPESQEPGTDVKQIVKDFDKLLDSLSRYNKAMSPLKSVMKDPEFQKLFETEEFRNKLKAGLYENDIDILLGTLRSITPESLMSETAKKNIQEAQEYLDKVSSYMTKCDLILSNKELDQGKARTFLEEISTLAGQGVVPYQKARARDAIKKALTLFKNTGDWENYVAGLE
jgi:hypothetical protein